jgi:hypothetical protein
MESKKIRRNYVTAKATLTISLLVAFLTILSIWLLGLGQHRTIFVNSILSTSILSGTFFLFLFINLYRGVKLKDDLGEVTDKITFDMSKSSTSNGSGFDVPTDMPDVGADGIEGILLGIVFWLLFSVLLMLIAWFIGAVFWALTLIFIAMLYWIFFRALRLVFKKSNRSKGNIGTSFQYAIGYTFLYNCWIYAIIGVLHYLVK